MPAHRSNLLPSWHAVLPSGVRTQHRSGLDAEVRGLASITVRPPPHRSPTPLRSRSYETVQRAVTALSTCATFREKASPNVHGVRQQPSLLRSRVTCCPIREILLVFPLHRCTQTSCAGSRLQSYRRHPVSVMSVLITTSGKPSFMYTMFNAVITCPSSMFPL